MVKTPLNKYIYAVGRRRSSVATVKLFTGKDASQVNGQPVNQYFPTSLDQLHYQKPFVTTETLDKYYFQAKVVGGGKNGQLGALVLALARALKSVDEDAFKPQLRAAGLLTVDSRVKERRKVGTGGKARRQKQSPKR
jgi:small subunit ribosomal protein S9